MTERQVGERLSEEEHVSNQQHADILYRVIEQGEPPTAEDIEFLSDKVDSLARQLAEAKAAATALNADVSALGRQLAEAEQENGRWLAWSGGQYPDDSPGDVIFALSDGTITLDDGVTTWNPLRALAWIEQQREANGARALNPPDPPASPAEGSEAATEVEA